MTISHGIRGAVRRLVLLTALVISAPPASSDAIFDEETAVVVAETAISNIPHVGPYLSLLSQILFAPKAQPSPAELRAQWEGYTNQKVSAARMATLGKKIRGFQASITSIEKLQEDRAAYLKSAGAQVSKAKLQEFDQRQLRSWESLYQNLERLGYEFESGDGEPAAPMLPMFAGVVHLQVDTLDRLIVLSQAYNPAGLGQFELQRARIGDDLNARLERQIQKAARERGSLVSCRQLSNEDAKRFRKAGYKKYPDPKLEPRELYWRGTQLGNHWVITDRGREQFVFKPSEPHFVAAEERHIQATQDARRREGLDPLTFAKSQPWIGMKPGVFFNSSQLIDPTRASSAQNLRPTFEWVYYKLCVEAHLIHRSRLRYLIHDTAILKVDLIHPDVTDEQFREIFARFGAVEKAGLVYKSDRGGYAVRRQVKKPNNRWQIQPISPGWKQAGFGYIEMKTASAMNAKGYWTSPLGKARSKGQRGLKREVLTSYAGLNIEEDKLFDPWEWKWK